MTDIRKLQNGSDVRGIACAGIAGEDVNLTEEAGNLIGGGFIRWLADKKGKKTNELRIGIGHDSRITADSQFPGTGLIRGCIYSFSIAVQCGIKLL